MKKLSSIWLWIAMVVVALTSCGHKSSTASDDGKDTVADTTAIDTVKEQLPPISLYTVNGLRKVSGVGGFDLLDPMSALPYDIDGGDINKSTDFFYQISNNSVNDIVDLQVSIDDTIHFAITPDSIGVIGAPNKGAGVTPIIRLTAIHGTNTAGLGRASLLSGDNYVTMTFSGKVADTSFSVSYVVKIHAKRLVLTKSIDTVVYHFVKSIDAEHDSVGLYDSLLGHWVGYVAAANNRSITTNLLVIDYATGHDGHEYKMSAGDSIIAVVSAVHVDPSSEDCYMVVSNTTGTMFIGGAGTRGYYEDVNTYYDIPYIMGLENFSGVAKAGITMDASCPIFDGNEVLDLR